MKMMNNQLDNDEGQMVNFDAATLRIAKENDDSDVKDAYDRAPSSRDVPRSSAPNVASIPFRHVDVHSFFSDRNEVVERAIKECQETLLTDQTDEIVGTWLLTEISLWDTEKERIVILTKNSILTVKYDFISLKVIAFHRIPLGDVDTVACGELEYPAASVAPRLNGFADGLSSVIQCAIRQQWSSIAGRTDIHFEPRKRNMNGVRIMWNKGKPLSFEKKWNPFGKRIPWITFANHPLYWHKGSNEEISRFDVDALQSALTTTLSDSCSFVSQPLIVENYLGLGAIIHNRNSLGFFKVRGKVSF
ncbi:tumor protein p63-regulated gene 1-like protein [Diachasmimorpha longicaudata]|uniref:tumor protein p63-regulated gene 1-like protein n=1 Tax=Diachasmimorpha longicaudata TaxID=58733 RepID=UPI0030B88E33